MENIEMILNNLYGAVYTSTHNRKCTIPFRMLPDDYFYSEL